MAASTANKTEGTMDPIAALRKIVFGLFVAWCVVTGGIVGIGVLASVLAGLTGGTMDPIAVVFVTAALLGLVAAWFLYSPLD